VGHRPARKRHVHRVPRDVLASARPSPAPPTAPPRRARAASAARPLRDAAREGAPPRVGASSTNSRISPGAGAGARRDDGPSRLHGGPAGRSDVIGPIAPAGYFQRIAVPVTAIDPAPTVPGAPV
jgi:hypothetical protein